MCQITSKPYADPHAIELTSSSFAQGNLSRVSYARPGKLFTANAQIILRESGLLNRDVFRSVIETVIDLLRHAAQV
jgi:mRNA interferase MazF